MTSFSIEGNKRHGKNILSTQLALWCAKRVGNIPIYANYTIFGYPNFIKFNKPSELIDVQNAIVVFDELGTTGDARSWKSKDQILFTHKFAQMEKDGITFIYTAQRNYLIEKRIREQTDYVIFCYKHPLTGKMYQTWFDTTRGRDDRQVGKKIGTFLVSPERVFKHYDTFEHIESNISFDDAVSRKPWSPKKKKPWEGGENYE